MKIKGGIASHGEALVDSEGRLLVDIAGGGGGGFTPINFSTSEQDTGIKWIGGETVFQKTINFGALPNMATKSVAHGIIGLNQLVEVSIPTKDTVTGDMNSVPFGGASVFRITSTDIVLGTTFNGTTTNAFVILTYIK